MFLEQVVAKCFECCQVTLVKKGCASLLNWTWCTRLFSLMTGSTMIPTVVGVVPMVQNQEIFHLHASLPGAEDQISSLLYQHCNMVEDTQLYVTQQPVKLFAHYITIVIDRKLAALPVHSILTYIQSQKCTYLHVPKCIPHSCTYLPHVVRVHKNGRLE